MWHSTDKYRRVILRCNGKYSGTERCSTPALDEKYIKDRFIEAFNDLFASKDQILADIEMFRSVIADTSGIDEEMKSLITESEIVGKMIDECIAENSRSIQDQDEFIRRYEGLVARYEKAKTRYDELAAQKAEKCSKGKEITRFAGTLISRPETIKVFDDFLWITSVEKVIVRGDGSLEFRFYGGISIKK